MHLVPVRICPNTKDVTETDRVQYTDWLDIRFGGKYVIDAADFQHQYFITIEEDEADEDTAYVLFTESQQNRRVEHENMYVRRMADYDASWYGNILAVKITMPIHEGGMMCPVEFLHCTERDVIAVMRHTLK